jgi:allophanate hydrolase
MLEELPFTLDSLRAAYAAGLRPEQVVAEAFRRLDVVADPGIFINAARDSALAEARALGPEPDRPLWGVPYVVKDNIDVAGMPTTAACPDFAYDAKGDAFVIARLRAAGAICLGKTNLDQFATGLVGVRSPFGAPRNALDPTLVPGGSSSGSAVAVAHGIAAFALGTDTAGSGRVPAALNGIVGLKPSLGALSGTGMVPACRTLDTISVFAMTVADAWRVLEAAAGYDGADAYSRAVELKPVCLPSAGLTVGVPSAASLETFGDDVQAAAFRRAVDALRERGFVVVELDFASFYEVARMLYEGAWLAERVAAVGDRLTNAPETLHPTTRAVLEPGLKLSAVDAFRGMYRLKERERACRQLLAEVDVLAVPTIPTFVTMEEIASDPIGPNSRLGTYTNFVNLLDMCGIAVPTGPRSDGRPGSVTLLAPAGQDALCAAVGTLLEAGPPGATGWTRTVSNLPDVASRGDEIAIAVCGAHMSGLPLNHELTSRGGRLLHATRTAPEYALYALSGGPPFRPGLVRRGNGGASIDLEVWLLPATQMGSFIAVIPAPLSIGTIQLEDGGTVKGFLCEAFGLSGSTDITASGGWRSWLARIEVIGSGL